MPRENTQIKRNNTTVYLSKEFLFLGSIERKRNLKIGLRNEDKIIWRVDIGQSEKTNRCFKQDGTCIGFIFWYS